MPDVISDKIRKYAVDKYQEDYDTYNLDVKERNLDVAKIHRDELIFKLKRHIDSNYADFENNLFLGKATSNVLFDITELGAAATIGITNGERAKTIIGTALTAFKGTRKSIDVNFFREKTTESLISTMRASRSRVEEKINLGLQNEVKDYTLEEALGDLIDYFYAGSLANALVELSQQASDNAKMAEKAAGAEIKNRLKKDFEESGDIDSIRNKIDAAFKTGGDKEKAEARTTLLRALETIKKELPAVNANFAVTDSNEVLFAELQRILAKAAFEDIPTTVILKGLRGN